MRTRNQRTICFEWSVSKDLFVRERAGVIHKDSTNSKDNDTLKDLAKGQKTRHLPVRSLARCLYDRLAVSLNAYVTLTLSFRHRSCLRTRIAFKRCTPSPVSLWFSRSGKSSGVIDVRNFLQVQAKVCCLKLCATTSFAI